MLVRIAGALLLAGQWSLAGASALSDAAAALQPGQWVQLSTQNFNSQLLVDGDYDVFYYSEDMTWDPVTRQILLVGGGHANDAEFLRYNEATNTWSRTKPTGGFWHGNFSHAYDHNAIIPSLGKFFHRQPAFDPSDRIEIYDIPTGVWSRSAAMPERPGCCGGLEYFPELNGLILANGDAGVLFYDPVSNSWQNISGASWGDYHNFAEYSPVHKTMIFGGGETSGTNAIFRMNANRQITRLSNAPGHMGITHSIVTTDPNSGNHLVFFNSSFYEFNPATDTWRLQSGDAPWNGGVFGTVATPISTYGVVMFAHYGGANDARVYLYRHSPGSGTTVPTVTLGANPTSVASGATTTLTWSSTDATGCTASGGWTGARATSGSETSAALTANTTFTLTCTNGQGGSTSRSVTVTVAPATPPPAANFSASPVSVAVGGSSTLSWTTTNATSCTGSGAWSGNKSVPNGSQSVGPINAASTYNLSCTGAGGSTQRSVTVSILPAPTLSFSANPTSVQAGVRSTLTWNSQNATGCSASGGWAGNKPASGSEQSPIINATATFNLTCTGAGGSTGQSVTVTVNANPPPPPVPTVTLNASPASVSVNGTSTLSWSSTNAAGCAASGAWSGSRAASGSEPTTALTNTSTFTLTCSGTGGTSNPRSVTVTVTPGGGGGGGGGGGDAETQESGGGSLDLLLLAMGALLLGARLLRTRLARFASSRVALIPAALLTISATLTAHAADLTNVTVVSTSGSSQTNVPVTFGHVFKPGDVPANASIGARAGSNAIALQVDRKATHPDGSLRHAVLSLVMPSMGANASQALTLTNTGSAPPGGAITAASLLATSFDTTINLDIGGTAYSAAARDLLAGSPATWLSGPVATEFLLSGPVRTSSGTAHPHLQARFHVRAYQGLQSVRVEAVLENDWAFETGPRNYTYNVTVNVAGRGAVYTQNSVNHYRQSRWRRVVWWGAVPSFTVRHDSAYLMATRAVPSYDTRVQVTSGAMNGWVSGLGTNPGVMSIGALEPNMPSPGGRFEIAPLPAFQAGYILSQDDRARRVTIGYGEQAGAWPMHYRDKTTDHPISIDTFPNATILGASGIFGNFPACGGTCSTNGLLPEASHHPTLAYLPYLITGDYYLMEEVVFWGNWVLFYGESGRHGGSQGLLVWDQVRGQAWMLRTLAQAAYAAPDAHPLKNYLEQKLQNNITYYRNNWVDSNPLGYLTNTGAASWLGLDNWIASWMDDFLTWTFGHIVALGFSEAQPVLAWKAKFPVGRLTDPGMCWVLASSYWPYVRGDRYAGGSNAFVTTWTAWRRNVIFGWDDDALRGTNSIGGREQELFDSQCGSSQMASILGIGQGQMIGWDGADAYPANIQAAAAVAVEAGAANAQQAFNVLTSRGGYPLNDYGDAPQWAVWPSTATASLPAVQISANPTAVTSGQTSTLTWNASNATSCTASGGWAGNKALSGSETTAAIMATTTYTLTCTNASGNSSAAATVTLQTAPAPTLTLTAAPTSVMSGGSSTLTWSSANTTSCTASGGWTGARATSGNQVINNITATTTYTLQCTGAGGNISRNAQVTVSANPAPTLTLTANPTAVMPGGNSTLTWSSANTTSCTASGGWTGTKATSGNQVIGNITATATYSLQCTGAGGNISRSAQVTVSNNPPPAPTVNLSASPTSVAVNDSAMLNWTSTNATSCTASGAWTGTKAAQGSESTGALSNTATYSLSCTGAGGTASDSVTVTVTPGGGGGGGSDDDSSGGGSLGWMSLALLLALSLARRGARILANARVAYDALARRHVLRAAAAGLTVSALVLTGCSSSGEEEEPSTQAPTLSLSANPMSVAMGGSTQLTWSSTDATSCTGSGDWSGTVAPSGTQTINNITSNKTFSAQCSGPGGTSAMQSVTVTVSGTPAPTVTLSANPTTVNSGGSTQLTWSSTNATACTASGGWSGAKIPSGNQTISNLTATTQFALQCSGAGGNSAVQTVTVTVNGAPPPPVPTLTFSGNPTTVMSGGSSMLSWSSTNATTCTASGAWSGPRDTTGTQNLTNLTATATYSLRCTGAGGNSPLRNVTITVTPLPAPTLSLSANPATINSGQQSVLTWNTSNVTACTASGGWSGAKNVNGSETVGPLTQTTTYTLSCTGTGGSVNRNATVTVNGGSESVQGSVDSSYIDRFGDNRIYVFNGTVTPDDYDGDSGDPITTIPVTQNANACTFRYGGGNLANGTYTIAFTQDAALDVPGQANTLVFAGTRQVTVASGGVTSDFRPSGILTVGPGRQFATLRDAQLAATEGAVIEIDAGTYTDDVTVWRQNRVTIRGVGGGRAHIAGNRVIPFESGNDRNNGMGLMVIRGTGITVENIEFSGARVTDENGAGIRNQGRDLTICNGYHHDNEDGYLGEALGTLLVEYSEFSFNGECPSGGCNHNLYIDGGDRLIFRHNYSHHSIIGHNLKTRAAENHILYNRLMDEQTGSSSYNIDVPNGGLTFVIGNLIQQGPQTDNSSMLNYGTEGLSGGRTHELYIVNNTFVNDAGFGGFTQVQGGTSLVRVINNLFVGPGSLPGGSLTTNLLTNSPGLVNEAGFDYHLTATSPARDAGTAPGSARGQDLTPIYQYVHKAQREARPTESGIDIGAYEYAP
ncbi:MAG TPA: hypothetical protein VJ764_04290 [Steroidobacteraceae bacterium]|nr:hypothetical protein [Steroidobacteraceae bacterium]